MKRYIGILSLIIISIGMVSCSSGGGDDYTANPSTPSAISVTSGRATLTVTPEFSTLQNDGIAQVTIVAALVDANGVGIENQSITFTADRPDVIITPPGATTTATYPGYGVSPYMATSITNSNGRTSVTVRTETAGIRPGSVGVMVEAPTGFNLRRLVTVNVVGVGVGGIFLAADPPTISVSNTAGGSTDVTVTITGTNGNPIEDMLITLNIGGTTQTGITDSDGTFTVTVFTGAACPGATPPCGSAAGTFVRSITITVTAGGVSRTITVNVVHS